MVCKVSFDGWEIERLISFVQLLRDNKTTLRVTKAVVEARASVLTDESSSVDPAILTFEEMPWSDNEGYKRSVYFHHPDPRGMALSFGGVNAIQENWRLVHVDFEIQVFPEPVIPDVTRLVTLLDPPRNRKVQQEPSVADITTCRRIVLGLSQVSAAEVSKLREVATKRLKEVLERKGLSVRSATLWIPLAEDLEISGAKLKLLDPLLDRYMGRSVGIKLALTRALRKKLNDRPLHHPGQSAPPGLDDLRNLVAHQLKRTAVLCKEIETTGGQVDNQDRIRLAMQELEAISLVANIDENNAGQLLHIALSLCKLRESILSSSQDLLRSLLMAALLAFARLYRRCPAQFSTTSDAREKIRSLKSVVLELADTKFREQDTQNGRSMTATLRIAAIAAAAQLACPADGSFAAGLVDRIESRVRVSLGRHKAETNDEACVCADAFAYLLNVDGPLHDYGAVGATFKTLARVWASTELPEVRRASARALIAALCKGFSFDVVRAALEERGFRKKGSLRAIWSSRAAESIQADLPSLVVVAVIERFDLLYRMKKEPPPEYAQHLEWSTFHSILRQYVDAEHAFAAGDNPKAIHHYSECIGRLESKKESAFQALDKGIFEILCQAFKARKAFAVLSQDGVVVQGAASVLWDSCQAYEATYKGLVNLAKEPNLNGAPDPDAILALSIARFFRGYRKASASWTAVVGDPSEPDMSHSFAEAHDAIQRAQSAGWSRLVRKHIKGMTAGVRPNQEGTPGTQVPTAFFNKSTVQHILAMLRWSTPNGSERSRRRWEKRLRELPAGWGKYPIRPIGLLAYARRLHW